MKRTFQKWRADIKLVLRKIKKKYLLKRQAAPRLLILIRRLDFNILVSFPVLSQKQKEIFDSGFFYY